MQNLCGLQLFSSGALNKLSSLSLPDLLNKMQWYFLELHGLFLQSVQLLLYYVSEVPPKPKTEKQILRENMAGVVEKKGEYFSRNPHQRT